MNALAYVFPHGLDLAEAWARFVLVNWCAQATGWLALGLLVSRLPRLRAAARHAVLLVSLIAAVAAPATLALPAHVGLRLPVAAESLPRVSPHHAGLPDYRGAVPAGASLPSPVPASGADPIGLAIIAIWLLLALGRLGTLGVGTWLVARWGRGGVPVDRSLLFEACRYHVADIPVLETNGVHVPTVVGILQPRILLPQGMPAALTPENLGHVLLHEEAHVRRRDPLWFLIAELAHALLCWHPLAEWSRRSLARAAEDSCDLRVLEHGARETSYARTLLTVLEHTVPAPRLGVVCPLGSAGAELRRRVGQILQGSQPASRMMAGLAAGMLGASGTAVGLVQFGVRPALPPPVPKAPQVASAVRPHTPPVRLVKARPAVRTVVAGGQPMDARRWAAARSLPGAEIGSSEPELAELKLNAPREGRTLVFLLDNSSSMRPYQAEARAEILAYLDRLATGDRFNVVAFASDVSQFSDLPVLPSEEALAQVRSWLEALPEAHGSNLGAGMLQALATPDLTSLVIYSDGKATGSVTEPAGLGELLARENHSRAQVLSVAFGSAASAPEFLPGVAPAGAAPPPLQADERPNEELRP